MRSSVKHTSIPELVNALELGIDTKRSENNRNVAIKHAQKQIAIKHAQKQTSRILFIHMSMLSRGQCKPSLSLMHRHRVAEPLSGTPRRIERTHIRFVAFVTPTRDR